MKCEETENCAKWQCIINVAKLTISRAEGSPESKKRWELRSHFGIHNVININNLKLYGHPYWKMKSPCVTGLLYRLDHFPLEPPSTGWIIGFDE